MKTKINKKLWKILFTQQKCYPGKIEWVHLKLINKIDMNAISSEWLLFKRKTNLNHEQNLKKIIGYVVIFIYRTVLNVLYGTI